MHLSEIFFKVNLVSEDKKRNGEGVWVNPASEKDVFIYEHGQKDEAFQVVLCSTPLTWNCPYKAILTARVTGDDTRPVVRPSDNIAITREFQ